MCLHGAERTFCIIKDENFSSLLSQKIETNMATCAAASRAGWSYKGKEQWKLVLLPIFLVLGNVVDSFSWINVFLLGKQCCYLLYVKLKAGLQEGEKLIMK